MPSFDETIARMKGLYTYGKEINESNDFKSHTLEYHAIAADGKSYGIIRECNKYYIKTAPKDKETLAEAYDYIGGFCNKKSYEYASYANALKQFELKMSSINEACEGDVKIETLDPFKKNEIMLEGTQKMQDEIARCRQIMYNASMIMNESTEIGASRKNDTVMYDGKNPEAETGKKGDEGNVKANANPEYKGSDTNGVDKKVAPFDNEPSKCKDQLSECGNCPNCGKAECVCNEEEQKFDGQECVGKNCVNEEDNEWGSEGVPANAGVGEADTDHNNDPFNQSINESDDEEDVEIEDNDTFDNDESDFEETGDTEEIEDTEEDETDADFDAGLEDDFSEEDDAEFNDEEFENEEDDDDLASKIEDLKAQIEALKAQINGEENDDFDEDDFVEDEEDITTDDEDEFGNDDFDSEDTEVEFDTDDMGDEEEIDYEEEDDDELYENVNQKLNRIVESVVNKVLNEDELHVFGKHPGYRKKPMELPTTGEDKNQWGEDWNDESVHSEEPFGSKIGNGNPFNELVKAVTKDVMYQLKKGIPIEGDKKKVD